MEEIAHLKQIFHKRYEVPLFGFDVDAVFLDCILVLYRIAAGSSAGSS